MSIMPSGPAELRHQAPKPPFPRRLAPALGLLVLSPVAAEYLIGYDTTIGHPLQLLAGLLIFAPLYGAVAVLIREVTRRAGRGWPTMLLLGLAFGLIQAGLIDQSLFNTDYRDIADWQENLRPTFIPGLGISAAMALNFLGGHMIWSFGAPIAVMEACVPRLADRPWLGRTGLIVLVVLYLSAATLVYRDQLETEQFVAAPAQIGATVVIALALGVLAFTIPRRPAPSPGRVPPAWLVGCCAVVALASDQLLPPTWAGVAGDVTVLALLGALLLYGSGRSPWGRVHVLAVGGTALVVRAALSFWVQPVGDPPLTAKYAANTVITLGVLLLLAWAYRRSHRSVGPPAAPSVAGGPTDR